MFTNTLMTAHSLARRVFTSIRSAQLLHSPSTQLQERVIFTTDWKNFYKNGKIALFMVSRLKLHGVTDLAD